MSRPPTAAEPADEAFAALDRQNDHPRDDQAIGPHHPIILRQLIHAPIPGWLPWAACTCCPWMTRPASTGPHRASAVRHSAATGHPVTYDDASAFVLLGPRRP